METNTSDNKRIAKNSFALFLRMILLMVINLYTSRVILSGLGVTDFGIYNVVGGFVSMFTVISGSLSSSISRYLTIALGNGEIEKLKHIFSTSLNMLYLMCLLLFIVLETFGIWFVNHKLNIPPDRLIAANCVYQLSLFTFCIDIICLPYNALIISYERMKAFAYISIVEAIGKLVIAFIITIFIFDHLIIYAILMAIVAICIRFLYSAYCYRNFPHCRYKFQIDIPLVKEMFGFASWNFFGVTSSMFSDQGVNMLLNIFFGPVVNTARGIALQINSAVTSFSGNFMTALNPQITKNYASNNQERYFSLVEKGTRFSFFLLLIVGLPVLLNTRYLIYLWLGVVPEYTVNFVRIILATSIVSALSNPLVTLLLATGDIKSYQLLVGGFRFIVLPVDYFLLKIGMEPEIVFFVNFVVEIICLSLRLYRLKVQVDFPILLYIKKVAIRIFFLLCIPFVIILLTQNNTGKEFSLFLCNSIICIVLTMFFIYIVGLNRQEQRFINEKIRKVAHHIKK